MWALIKRGLPKSLFGRALLIIVAPVVLLQIIAAVVFFERHLDTVTRRMARAVAGDILFATNAMEKFADPAVRADTLALANRTMNLNARLHISTLPEEPGAATINSRQERIIQQTIALVLTRPFTIERIDDKKAYRIAVPLSDGVVAVLVPFNRFTSATARIVVLWTVGGSLLLLTVAVIFMRNQLRPIARLAKAAEQLGTGQTVTHFKAGGAREVRQAATAFLQMRDRIDRQIRQRTEMLAGVSHDLRTPLTRMKLSLALLDDAETAADLRQDVEEMARMVDGYLAFARGAQAEIAETTNLGQLLQGIVARSPQDGFDVSLECAENIVLQVKKQALRRCIENLLGNAERFARRASIHVIHQARAILIHIDDDGPGIPENEREQVFRPFYRLEHSRNRDTGGIGLGLAIARDTMRSHGGDVYLDRSPLGGLRVTVRLPV